MSKGAETRRDNPTRQETAKSSRKGRRRCCFSEPSLETAKNEPPACITLLTDFGVSDPYVGIMKGVIASINPSARVIDLSHAVEPQDVDAAAFLLARSYSYFPAGTIHVAVVDPGVGGKRPALCVQSGGYFFVGPDNGVLSPACYDAGRPRIFLLEERKYFLENVSHTFHGRDIFAPVAAHLGAGVAIERLGRRLKTMQRIKRARPRIRIGQTLEGEVVHIDTFGNLITNIAETHLLETFGRSQLTRVIVACSGHKIEGVRATYAAVRQGTAVAVVGSYGLLEIAVRNGSAAQSLALKRGDRITVEKQARKTTRSSGRADSKGTKRRGSSKG